MDYYYSLLENYEQLKRRKFRLSLREEEAADLASVANDVATELGRIRNEEEGHKEEGLGNGKNLSVEVTKGKGVSVTGSNLSGWGIKLSGSQIGSLATSWQKENSNANKLVKAWAGGGEEEGDTKDQGDTGEEGQEGEGGDDQGLAMIKQVQDLTEKVVTSFRELAQMAGITPGLEEKRGRGIDSLANVAAGQTKGFFGDVERLEQQVFNSDKLSPEEKLGALEGLQQIDLSIRQLRGRAGSEEPMSEAEAKKLGKLLESITITRGGVLIRGIGFQFREKSSPKNDALRNMVDQLNNEAERYNKQLENLPDEDQRKYKIPVAKPPESPAKTGGVNESYRGPVAEKFMTISANIMRGQAKFAQAETGAEKKKALHEMRQSISDTYEDALSDGSYDQMMETFSVGRSVALGELLAKGEAAYEDAQFVIECQRVLTEEMGMDEKKAEAFIEQASTPSDRQLMMSILVTSFVNQTFDKQLFGDDPDLIPTKVTHEGDKNMTDSGAKADLKFEFDKDCDKVAASYEKKLGGTPKNGCGGEGSGVKNMLTPTEGGGCVMEVELKTLTDSKSKGGVGEISSSRTQAICGNATVGSDVPGGMTQGTKDFAKRNSKRLNSCAGAGTQKAGCAKQKEIDEKTAEFDRLLTPGSLGVTPEMSDAWINTWFEKKQQSPKNKERAEAAKRAMRPNATKEDLDALAKVKQDIQQEVLKQEMPQGEVTDEGWKSWATMCYSQAAGSMEETLRVTRGLGDSYQSVYLNNAVVEDNLQKIKDNKAYFEYGGGGTIKLVDRKTGDTLVSCDTARGNQKWTMGTKSGHRNVLSEDKSAEEEELFITFLKGQRELLEKLMHQTNNGPST